MNQVTVIKYGGSLLEDLAHRASFLTDIAALSKRQQVVLVHGGGKEISRQMEKAGLVPKFVDGRRFTDEKTMEVVKTALAGLNTEIVKVLKEHDADAKGYSGQHKHVLLAEPIADLGRVGIPKTVDKGALKAILTVSQLPVFYSVGEDSAAKPLNINADDFALAIAVACQASRLVFLTDTGGVNDAQGQTIRKITPADVPQLIKDNVVTGGMVIKIEACAKAVLDGVGRVDICKGIQAVLKGNGSIDGTAFYAH